MMTFQPDPVCAPRKHARLVPPVQRTLERSRDRPALASDRQRCAVLILDDLGHASIAAEPARGRSGHECLAQLTDLDGIRYLAAQAPERNRQRDVDRRTI